MGLFVILEEKGEKRKIKSLRILEESNICESGK